MGATPADLLALGPPLQAKLSELAHKRNLPQVHIRCWANGTNIQASTEANTSPSWSNNSHSEKVKVGCLAKMLTATLIAQACGERRLTLEQSVTAACALKGLSSRATATLASIRIRDLLNHSHGIDSSSVTETVLRGRHGLIDSENLFFALFAAPMLSEPGAHFSYSHCGSWIAAVVLEHIYSASYPAILHEKLLFPLGIEASVGRETLATFLKRTNNKEQPASNCSEACDEMPMICPATGKELRMSAADILVVARNHLVKEPIAALEKSGGGESIASLRRQEFLPSSWHPRVSSICLGYNSFGDGWYGHNSNYDGHSAIIRFCPLSNLAIAITATQESIAYNVLGSLFGKSMREFASPRMPRLQTPSEWSAVVKNTYCGTYENSATRLAIDLAANGLLRARVYKKHVSCNSGEPEPLIKRYLRPAAEHVFFSDPPDPLAIPFLQYLDSVANGDSYRYVCNGRQLFVRQSGG